MTRSDGRRGDELRPVNFQTGFVDYPEGSVLISLGKTRVLCNVSVEDSMPAWMDKGDSFRGWITAEYALLPRSTSTRVKRESGGSSSRSQEIKRLVGRSLRAGFNLNLIGRRTLIVDCDVIQADGGTRTASITGGYLALRMALQTLISSGLVPPEVLLSPVAAISVGLIDGQPLLDLDYAEDARAEADLNVVMNQAGDLIELQGSAEGTTYSRKQLTAMLDYAEVGIKQLFQLLSAQY
jgi:ribonuclease PH